MWVNIAEGNFLHNVGPWLTENFYEEDDLYNKAGLVCQRGLRKLREWCAFVGVWVKFFWA